MHILHFLADGRVGGPQVRIVRVHEAMLQLDTPIETIVACPPTQPDGYFDRQGMQHVLVQWHKPRAEQPLLSGLGWLFSGLWKDVSACRKIIRQYPRALAYVNGAILLAAAIAAVLEKAAWVWHLNDTSVPRFLALVVRAVLYWGKGRPIAASNSVVKYYRLPANSSVLYPPVQVMQRQDAKQNLVNYLGVMANLSPGKGIENVIEAFALATCAT